MPAARVAIHRSVAAMNRRPTPRLFALLALLGSLGLPAGRVSAAEPLWETQPYRIQMIVAVAPSPYWTADAQRRLLKRLSAGTQAVAGSIWDLDATAAPTPWQRLLRGELSELSAEEVATLRTAAPISGQEEGDADTGMASGNPDKLLLVRIAPASRSDHLSLREFDVETSSLGPTVERTVYRRDDLAGSVVRLLSQSFCPVARVESIAGDEVHLRIRGIDLSASDPLWRLVQPGDVFRLFSPSGDSTGSLSQTLLAVEGVDPLRVRCRAYQRDRQLLSDLGLSPRSLTAVGVGRPHGSTTLRLSLSEAAPARAFDVAVRLPTVRPPRTQHLGRTDSAGTIQISPQEALLQLVTIRSAGQELARIPIVPGLLNTVSVQIAATPAQLTADAAVAALEEELLDLVARYDLQVARINQQLSAGQRPVAQQLLEDWDHAAALKQFQTAVAARRKTAVSPVPEDEAKFAARIEQLSQLADRQLGSARYEKLASQVKPPPEPKPEPTEAPAETPIVPGTETNTPANPAAVPPPPG